MDWKPKTDAEIAQESLLPNGIYAAEILNVEERIDKNKNPFLMLKIGVYADDWQAHVYDNVSSYWMEFKFKHLFDSAGKADLYEAGKMDPSDMLHWQLTVLLSSEAEREYTDKEGVRKTAPPKNIVKDYLTPDMRPTQAARESVAKSAVDPDLPFSLLPLVPFLIAFIGIGARLFA